MIQILISKHSIIYAPLSNLLAALSHIFPFEPGEHALSYGSPIYSLKVKTIKIAQQGLVHKQWKHSSKFSTISVFIM